MIRVLVMDSVNQNPTCGRILKTTNAQGRQQVLEPNRAFETTVGQQPVVTRSDSHRRKDVIADGQNQQQPPAGKKVRQERDRNQQVKQHDRNQVRPKNLALLGHALGFGQTLVAPIAKDFGFDMDVFGLSIDIGQVRFVGGVVGGVVGRLGWFYSHLIFLFGALESSDRSRPANLTGW